MQKNSLNESKLSQEEQAQLQVAVRLAELIKQEGWQDFLSIISAEEKRQYPNPKAFKDVNELTLAYTFARGGTELLKSTIQIINNQVESIENLRRKEMGEGKFANFGWKRS